MCDNNVNNECFTFTAEHEEPCCGFCDYVCASQNICNHCGPGYGWRNYRRTVNVDDFTPTDEDIYKEVMTHLKVDITPEFNCLLKLNEVEKDY